MARVNADILGVSELKWTGMGEFNSDDHYIYYCGQESLRRNRVAIMVNKRVRNEVLLLLLLSHFSRVWLCATPETAAHQLPPSLGFSRQEYWSGLPFPSPMHESEKWKWSRSVVSDSERPHTAAPQAPPSMGFSRQEYWSGVPLPFPRNAVLGCNLKNDRMISVHFQGKPFNIMVIQVYAPTSNAEKAEVEQFHEDLQDLLELTPRKDVLFIIGDWNTKVGSQNHQE